jgi:hypothetical protein
MAAKARCATDELHIDRRRAVEKSTTDVPSIKGGTSFSAANVKWLCTRHNLAWRARIV